MDPAVSAVDRMPLRICGLLLVVGGLFLAGGMFWFLQTAQFLGSARPSAGIVVAESHSTTVSLKGGSQHRQVRVTRSPVVVFRDEPGGAHHLTASSLGIASPPRP